MKSNTTHLEPIAPSVGYRFTKQIIQFTRRLSMLFPLETRGIYGQFLDGCLYNAALCCISGVVAWRRWAREDLVLHQFVYMADFLVAENQ